MEGQQREHIPPKTVVAVSMLSLCGPLCVDLYLPALPAVATDLQAAASMVQATLTSCLLGLAVGQVIVGAWSDRVGRRRPLLLGLAVFVLASGACAAVPGIADLLLFRFAEGVGGAAGLVLARAIVRDMYSGDTAARFYSLQMVVVGGGPMLAPILGAALLHLGSWRLLFLALAIIGSVLALVGGIALPETLLVADRTTGGVRTSLGAMSMVAHSRGFIVNACVASFALGAVWAYVAGSAFVLENVYGLTPQIFSLLYGMNAVGLIGASLVNSRIVYRFGAARVLCGGLIVLTGAAAALVVLTAVGEANLFLVAVCMFLTLAAFGFIGGNATALALNDHATSAGSASALLGVLEFTVGATIAPLTGLGGSHALMPMAVAMSVCGVIALGVRVLFGRRSGMAAGHPSDGHVGQGQRPGSELSMLRPWRVVTKRK